MSQRVQCDQCDSLKADRLSSYVLRDRTHAGHEQHFCDIRCLSAWAFARVRAIEDAAVPVINRMPVASGADPL